jgi:uncharacterized membrane protein YidH (DUF202 family)
VPSGGPHGEQIEVATGRIDPGLARERTALAWTRSALSIAVSGALIVRACLAADLDLLGTLIAILMAVLTLAVWRYGQETHAGPGVPDAVRRGQGGVLAGLTTVTLVTALLAIIVTLAV